MKNLGLIITVLALSACAAPCPCEQQQAVYDDQYQPMPMQPAEVPSQQLPSRNIIVKDRTPYSVTYEFYNVRLDELVKYAKEYCGYINMTPILRESLTAPNNSRIATFDCVNPDDLK